MKRAAADGIGLTEVLCHLRTDFELLEEQVRGSVELGAFTAL